jgi:hypothetical protein
MCTDMLCQALILVMDAIGTTLDLEKPLDKYRKLQCYNTNFSKVWAVGPMMMVYINRNMLGQLLGF